MIESWLFAIVFVVSFTYTVLSLVRRVSDALDQRQRNMAHRRRYW